MPARKHHSEVNPRVFREYPAASDQIVLILLEHRCIRLTPEDDAGSCFCFALAPVQQIIINRSRPFPNRRDFLRTEQLVAEEASNDFRIRRQLGVKPRWGRDADRFPGGREERKTSAPGEQREDEKQSANRRNARYASRNGPLLP